MKKFRRSLADLVLTTMIAILVFVGQPPSFADQVTLKADRDAYNNPWGLGNPNNGANIWALTDGPTIDIGGWDDFRVGFIHFNINSIPSQVASMSLRLYCLPNGGVATNMEMDFWVPTSAWSETTVFDSSGPRGYNLGRMAFTPKANSWMSIGITNVYNHPLYGPLIRANGVMLVPRATNNNFNIFASSEHFTTTYRPQLVVTYTPDSKFRLSFPLKGSDGKNLSPYTTMCVGVPDLDRTSGVMKSHNGEVGSGTAKIIDDTTCYPKQGGGAFNLWPLDGYNDGDGVGSLTQYLCYDNHSGHDYSQNANTKIYAAADGFLTVAVSEGSSGLRPDGLWRNKTACPDVVPTITTPSQWDANHAMYIVHQGGYTTWYLHTNSLDATVLSQIKAYGYAPVKRGQVIGYVGGFGKNGPNTYGPHLHFGLKKSGVTGTLADPYGNGSTPTTTSNAASRILWDVLP